MEVSSQFDALAALNRTAGLDVTRCQKVNIYRRFERAQCLHKHRFVNCVPRRMWFVSCLYLGAVFMF